MTVVACVAAGATGTTEYWNGTPGTFEYWHGRAPGWVSNDAESATLAKQVTRFRMTLSGMERTIETGEPEFAMWIRFECRARNPVRPPSVWISLPGHPDQERVPHWLTNPIGFAWTLARHGEFERTPLRMIAGGRTASATLIRRLVVAWTESHRPWMSIEFDDPVGTGRVLLADIAKEMGPETITLTGGGTRFEMNPEWNDEDRAMAADMDRHCP